MDVRNSSSNKQQLRVRLACGEHTVQLQLRSLLKSWQRAVSKGEDSWSGLTTLHCKVCDVPCGMHGAALASHFERKLYALLQSRFPDLQWQHESRVLGRLVDVWVPAVQLIIQVDGPHHFWGASGEQASSDRTHEQALVHARGQAVRGMLRLHYQDGSDVWAACVARALHLARQSAVACFVCFSPSFERPEIVVPLP